MKELVRFTFPKHEFQRECSIEYNIPIAPQGTFITKHLDTEQDKQTEILALAAEFYSLWGDVVAVKDFGGGTIATTEHRFEGCWMTSINFGDLEYTSCSDVELEITWRYNSVS